jgi:hypothetical protein
MFTRRVLACALLLCSLTIRSSVSSTTGSSEIQLTVVACREDQAETPIVTATLRSPTVSLPITPPRRSVAWSRVDAITLRGIFRIAPGLYDASIETSHCRAGWFPLAVLADRKRHYSEIMLPKDVYGHFDYSLVVAGSLPLPDMIGSLGGENNVVVDDDAYYFLAENAKYRLRLAIASSPGFSTTIDIDATGAPVDTIYRQDVTLQSFLKGIRLYNDR